MTRVGSVCLLDIFDQLESEFGERCADHRRRTRRLLPFLY